MSFFQLQLSSYSASSKSDPWAPLRSIVLLNGGSVAMRSIEPLLSPRRKSRLSP